MFEVSSESTDASPHLLIWPLGKDAEAGHVGVVLIEGRLTIKFALHLHGIASAKEAEAIELAIKLAQYVARTGKGGSWSPPVRDEVHKFMALVRAERANAQKTQQPDLLEPDWREAPAWAQWWAVGSKGYAHWFEDEPTPKHGAWRSPGKSLRTGQSIGQRFAPWRASLCKRSNEGLGCRLDQVDKVAI